MKEIWTTEAKHTFQENIRFLKSRWTLKEVNAFKIKTFECLDLLLTNPQMGQYDKNWDCYKFLIVKQIYLFYELQENDFVLISFWNNYQKPLSRF